MFYRYNESKIGYLRLNDAWRPIPRTSGVLGIDCNEDPRVVWFENRIYLSTHWAIAGRIELRELEPYSNNKFQIHRDVKFDHIWNDPKYRKKRREKNWTPWVWQGQLLYTHTLSPHRVLKVDVDDKRALLMSTSFWSAPWWRSGWGAQFRLNTPPVRLSDGTYLSTFHCAGVGGYFSGFYLFEGQPPFQILRVSREPALTPSHATQRNPRTGVTCIFLLGLLVNESEDCVIATGGDNDHSVVAFYFSLKEVIASLAPVSREPARLSTNPLTPSDGSGYDDRFRKCLQTTSRLWQGIR
jgi:hypothetical protein